MLPAYGAHLIRPVPALSARLTAGIDDSPMTWLQQPSEALLFQLELLMLLFLSARRKVASEDVR